MRRAADAIERVLLLWGGGGSPCLGNLLLGFLHTFGFAHDLSREKIILKVSKHYLLFVFCDVDFILTPSLFFYSRELMEAQVVYLNVRIVILLSGLMILCVQG